MEVFDIDALSFFFRIIPRHGGPATKPSFRDLAFFRATAGGFLFFVHLFAAKDPNYDYAKSTDIDLDRSRSPS